jgi:hypothetical protein
MVCVINLPLPISVPSSTFPLLYPDILRLTPQCNRIHKISLTPQHNRVCKNFPHPSTQSCLQKFPSPFFYAIFFLFCQNIIITNDCKGENCLHGFFWLILAKTCKQAEKCNIIYYIIYNILKIKEDFAFSRLTA